MYTKMPKKIMNSKYITVSVLSFLVTFNNFAQQPVVIDKIIAKVDNNIVLKSDVERRYLDALANGVTPTPDLKCMILGGMIQEKLMVAKAEIDSIVVSDAEVELNLSQRMDMIMKQYNGSEEIIMEYYGKTLEDIRIELRDQVREQMIGNKMQQHLTADITVTPSEIRKFFKQIPQDSLPYYDMEVEVAQIVINVEPGKIEKDKAREILIELRKRIINGEDFGTLAIQFSQGPSAPQGGDLGMTSRGAMVPAFEAAALALRPGELSMPVETEFGLHLIKLEERRGNEYHPRHILLQPVPSENDIKKAENKLDSLRTLIVNDSISFETVAREHSDDDLTKGSGGYFVDATGTSKVSIRELDPEIYFAVDSMKTGSVSPIMRFQNHEGKQAVRIIYYKTSKNPHQANLSDDWQKIQAAALMEKKNKILMKWFDKAKNDVFMYVDEEYDQCKILN